MTNLFDQTNRRKFVKNGLFTLGATTLGLQYACTGSSEKGNADSTLVEAPPVTGIPADRFPGFNMGIQSYSLRGFNLEEALMRVQQLGLKYVEFYSGHYPLDLAPEDIQATNALLAKYGVTASAHGVNGFSADHEKNKAIFEFAKNAGIKNLGADPDPDSFDSLDKLVAEYNIRICIHNHGPSHRYSTVDNVLDAIKDRHPLIGACADLGHFIRSAQDPVTVIQALKGRLYGIHFKDFAEMTGEAEGVIIGKGQLDVEGSLRAIKEVNFPADGALSLEYEENEKDPVADIKECLDIVSAAAIKIAG
ncbi:MAG: sugar phosphate isomerase/epimerase [Cyclobacteriaceae bacterium]|nr:sugar phosphate isomerase/epimerase [Cyclobacteriaceae bacterium]